MNKPQLNSKYFSLVVTILLFVLLFAAGSMKYTVFFTLQNFLNLFIDNAYLIIMATGTTFVLINGGIDISVGAVLSLTCMLSAYLLESMHFNPFFVMFLMIALGAVFGLVQGSLIHFFKLQPFIVTLAGMFFARGMTAVISIDTIDITDKTYEIIANYRIPVLGGAFISISVVIAVIVLLIGIYIAHFTKFGRSAYAIGGNEQSAILMGLPVGRTKVCVYMLGGICSALSGIVFSFYMRSGFTLHGLGMEMESIASVVIGGTLLTGGVGHVFGTLFGVLIQGTIQTLIMFQGTLSSWWTKIAVAFLLFLFIVMQSLLTSSRLRKKSTGKVTTEKAQDME